MSAVLNVQSSPLLRPTMGVRLFPGFDSRFGLILLISLAVHLFMLVIFKVNMDFEGGPAGSLEITLIPLMGDTSRQMFRRSDTKDGPYKFGPENFPVPGHDAQTMTQEYFRAEDARRWKESSKPWIFSYPPSDVFGDAGGGNRFRKSSRQTVPKIQAYKTSNGNIDIRFRSQSGKIYCIVIRRPDPFIAYDQGAHYLRNCS